MFTSSCALRRVAWENRSFQIGEFGALTRGGMGPNRPNRVLLQIFKNACPAWLRLLQEISLNTLP